MDKLTVTTKCRGKCGIFFKDSNICPCCGWDAGSVVLIDTLRGNKCKVKK